MKIVGRREERPLSFDASAELLAIAGRFLAELHKFPGANLTGIPKGVRRFKTHDEMNRYDDQRLAEHMARLARSRHGR